MQKFLKRYPVEIGIAAIAAIALISSAPAMMQNAELSGQLAREVQLKTAEANRLRAIQDDLAAKDAIARERFKSCLLVRTKTSQTVVGVTNGLEVVDNVTGLPLPEGTVVCSIDGNTGIIAANGKVADVAFTGDRALVAEALARSGIELAPSDPNFGSSNRVPGADA